VRESAAGTKQPNLLLLLLLLLLLQVPSFQSVIASICAFVSELTPVHSSTEPATASVEASAEEAAGAKCEGDKTDAADADDAEHVQMSDCGRLGVKAPAD
jgi:hypothetical protein